MKIEMRGETTEVSHDGSWIMISCSAVNLATELAVAAEKVKAEAADGDQLRVVIMVQVERRAECKPSS